MPQFDTSTFASQIFWLVVCFVALYVLVSQFAIPRISEVLEQRVCTIEDDLERAHVLKVEMEEVQAAYEKVLIEARTGARLVLQEAREALSREVEARNAEISLRLSSQIKEGEARIAKVRDEALNSVQGVVAVDIVVSVADRLLGVPAGSSAVRNVIASVLAQSQEKETIQ